MTEENPTDEELFEQQKTGKPPSGVWQNVSIFFGFVSIVVFALLIVFWDLIGSLSTLFFVAFVATSLTTLAAYFVQWGKMKEGLSMFGTVIMFINMAALVFLITYSIIL
jgi:hypothetical protein